MQGTLVSLNRLLIGDRLFNIPVYQRSYSWERKNLEDLWEDLYYLDPSKKHFFGTILLKVAGNIHAGAKTFEQLDVIDGQQRLTTILILFREIFSQMKAIDDEELQEQVLDLEKDYLKYGLHYKLDLQEDDTGFFKNYVIDDNEHPSETQTSSQQRLMVSKLFFRTKLNEEKKSKDPSEFKSFLTRFKRKIDDLQIIQYLVSSDSDAIRIFETANDRGKPLSNLEKTKSFLMHTSYLGLEDEDDIVQSRLKELNSYFSQIYRHFDDVSETKRIEWLSEDDIQRYHFINYISSDSKRNASTRYMDELKNLIRRKLIHDAGDSAASYAFDYAQDLSQAFFAVKDIAEMPEKNSDELGKLLNKIFLLDRLGNIFPLLITSYLRFGKNPSRMLRILKLIEAVSFRAYAIVGRRSDAGVTRLNGLANRVHQRKANYNNLIRELKDFNREYSAKGTFENILRSEDSYNNLSTRDIKYLLSEYETYLREESREPLPIDQEEILSTEYQVEHIWAQDTSRLNLSAKMKPLHEQNVHRLGNLTLASKSWNASMGNKPFVEKKRKYGDSSLRVQRDLTNWSRWSVKAIREREDAIVEFALNRWKV